MAKRTPLIAIHQWPRKGAPSRCEWYDNASYDGYSRVSHASREECGTPNSGTLIEYSYYSNERPPLEWTFPNFTPIGVGPLHKIEQSDLFSLLNHTMGPTPIGVKFGESPMKKRNCLLAAEIFKIWAPLWRAPPAPMDPIGPRPKSNSEPVPNSKDLHNWGLP